MESMTITYNEFGEFEDYTTNSQALSVLGAAMSCELEDYLETIWTTIFKDGYRGAGGNVTNVDIDNNIVQISLNPHVFGEDSGVFETDLVQFKYLLGTLIHLKKNGARTILITRKDGKITVEETRTEISAS